MSRNELARVGSQSNEHLDEALALLSVSEARLKLRIGMLLDALFLRRGHHELGFSSMQAYVAERCQRGRSWGRLARAVARNLRERELTLVRNAIQGGQLGWSQAELLSHHATKETEADLIRTALSCTYRELRRRLTGRSEPPAVERLRVTRWVSSTELIMLEATRKLVDHLASARTSDDDFACALLGRR